MELLLHQWGDWPELYRNTDKTEATEIVIIDSQMNYRGKLDTYESHISLLTTSPPRSIIQSYETSDDEEGCLNLFQRDSGRCELPMGQGLSTSEIKMKNLSGSSRYRRLKMAGRQFGWYRGCSRPFEDGGRFLLSVY